VKRQPRSLYRGQRKAPLDAALVLYDQNLLPRLALYRGDLDLVGSAPGGIAGCIARYHRRPTDELSPIARIPERSFQTRRRNLEHVTLAAEVQRIEPFLDGSRCSRAVIDRDRSTVLPLDADVENGPSFATAHLQLEYFKTKWPNF
jgi:hypothetical protein